MLIPDFRGHVGHLLKVVEAGPDVIAQNLETVKRLTHPVRDAKASYETTLEVLRNVKTIDPSRLTKSSLMVGLGETADEMRQAMEICGRSGSTS